VLYYSLYKRIENFGHKTALAKHIPVSLQLLLSTAEIESKLMLKEFEERIESKEGQILRK
jgi:hypothetical protein